MWGNTTTSRKGSKGNSMTVAGKGVCPDMVKHPICKKINPRVDGKSGLLGCLAVDQ